MAENHNLRKVYNYEFTCPNCKELINSLRDKKVRIPFYCGKCATKLPLDLKVRRWEELEDISIGCSLGNMKCRPKKFSELEEKTQREQLEKIELKIKLFTEEYTCPSCGYYNRYATPFGITLPFYCGECGAKLPLDLNIKRGIRWEKRNLFTLLEPTKE